MNLTRMVFLACLTLPFYGAAEQRFLYVATPGIRNYVEYGGVGILVFDIDNGHRFVKRIPTWEMAAGQAPENVKGIAAHAKTGRIYISTPKRIASFDLVTEKKLWEEEVQGGADRMALSPKGDILYVPSFEGPHWNVLNAATGELITQLKPDSGAHNTIYGPDGKHAYLAGLKSTMLSIADARAHQIVKTVGPFGHSIRPFTINGKQTLCFVNVNGLLGFEVGDMKSGKMLHRVVVEGYKQGSVKRHGCPSHGIGLTPDEKEIWVVDGHNNSVHIFDATVMPPKQVQSLLLRDQPGWITFSIDGKYAYPSTGEVIDSRTRKTLALLQDETGRQVQSEKMLEVVFNGKMLVRAGNQFGIGGKN